MSETAKVELAYPMTINGREYRPDDVVDLPRTDNRDGGPTALQLVRDGRARWHNPEDNGTVRRVVAKKAAKRADQASTEKSEGGAS